MKTLLANLEGVVFMFDCSLVAKKQRAYDRAVEQLTKLEVQATDKVELIPVKRILYSAVLNSHVL